MAKGEISSFQKSSAADASECVYKWERVKYWKKSPNNINFSVQFKSDSLHLAHGTSLKIAPILPGNDDNK